MTDSVPLWISQDVTYLQATIEPKTRRPPRFRTRFGRVLPHARCNPQITQLSVEVSNTSSDNIRQTALAPSRPSGARSTSNGTSWEDGRAFQSQCRYRQHQPGTRRRTDRHRISADQRCGLHAEGFAYLTHFLLFSGGFVNRGAFGYGVWDVSCPVRLRHGFAGAPDYA